MLYHEKQRILKDFRSKRSIVVSICNFIKVAVPGPTFALISLLKLVAIWIKTRGICKLHFLLLFDACTNNIDGWLCRVVLLSPIVSKLIKLSIIAMLRWIFSKIRELIAKFSFLWRDFSKIIILLIVSWVAGLPNSFQS